MPSCGLECTISLDNPLPTWSTTKPPYPQSLPVTLQTFLQVQLDRLARVEPHASGPKKPTLTHLELDPKKAAKVGK